MKRNALNYLLLPSIMVIFLVLAWKTPVPINSALYSALAVMLGAYLSRHFAFTEQPANEQA